MAVLKPGALKHNFGPEGWGRGLGTSSSLLSFDPNNHPPTPTSPNTESLLLRTPTQTPTTSKMISKLSKWLSSFTNTSQPRTPFLFHKRQPMGTTQLQPCNPPLPHTTPPNAPNGKPPPPETKPAISRVPRQNQLKGSLGNETWSKRGRNVVQMWFWSKCGRNVVQMRCVLDEDQPETSWCSVEIWSVGLRRGAGRRDQLTISNQAFVFANG